MARSSSGGGLSLPATAGLDRWSFKTEPGLQTRSFFNIEKTAVSGGFFLFPFSPDIRRVADGRLLAVADDRCFNKPWAFEELFKLCVV